MYSALTNFSYSIWKIDSTGSSGWDAMLTTGLIACRPLWRDPTPCCRYARFPLPTETQVEGGTSQSKSGTCCRMTSVSLWSPVMSPFAHCVLHNKKLKWFALLVQDDYWEWTDVILKCAAVDKKLACPTCFTINT